MQIRRHTQRTKSCLATITMLGFVSTTSRRTFVRAAFTAGNVGCKSAFSGVSPYAYTNSRSYINHATNNNKFASYERGQNIRPMSTTSTDEELDSALNELLGEALKDAEPVAEASRGRIEGSHPFPKDLVETVCYSCMKTLSLDLHLWFLMHLLFYIISGRRLYRSQISFYFQSTMDTIGDLSRCD